MRSNATGSAANWAFSPIVNAIKIDAASSGGSVDPASVGLPPEFPRDVATVVTLTPRGEQTEVTISERTTSSQFLIEMSQLGLEQVMDKMGRMFAR